MTRSMKEIDNDIRDALSDCVKYINSCKERGLTDYKNHPQFVPLMQRTEELRLEKLDCQLKGLEVFINLFEKSVEKHTEETLSDDGDMKRIDDAGIAVEEARRNLMWEIKKIV